jgi:hypothetical protein
MALLRIRDVLDTEGASLLLIAEGVDGAFDLAELFDSLPTPWASGFDHDLSKGEHACRAWPKDEGTDLEPLKAWLRERAEVTGATLIFEPRLEDEADRALADEANEAALADTQRPPPPVSGIARAS